MHETEIWCKLTEEVVCTEVDVARHIVHYYLSESLVLGREECVVGCDEREGPHEENQPEVVYSAAHLAWEQRCVG